MAKSNGGKTERSSGGQTQSTRNSVKKDSTEFPLVGVGASAGGLEALSKFFYNLAPQAGFAIVVVTHMDPHRKSLMGELLSKQTTMTVREAEDGQKVELGHVYVIPPNRDLIVENGRLRLCAPATSRGVRQPVDTFFRSLAMDRKEKAIGIILSGTGSDGALGLKEIKGVGGMVMAQSPETAKYDGMPRGAISTGEVDFVLDAEDMPVKLLEYAERSKKLHTAAGVESPPASQDEVARILALVRHRLGHDFTHYKRNTINRRLKKRMLIRNTDTFEKYHQLLERDHDEAEALFKDLLIGVTSFFRDAKTFEIIEKAVVPKLFEGKKPDDSVRVWVPGCSTGEEAYSLAILLQEHMDRVKRVHDAQVFATDIDAHAIDVARAASYSESIAVDVTPERLERFFHLKDGRYTVVQNIREMVVFAPHDLLREPPFRKLDLLSCRNLLIYMTPETQKKILPQFFHSLNPGGHMVLGSSETIGEFGRLFEATDKSGKVFRRKEVEATSPVDFPLTPRRLSHATRERTLDLPFNHVNPSNVLERQLLKQYAHPAVLIDQQLEILSYFGDTSPFLVAPDGPPTENLLKKARRGLKLRLRAAIRKAIKTNKPVTISDLKFPEKGDRRHNVRVEPVHDSIKAKGLLYVVFEGQPSQERLSQPAIELELDESSSVPRLEEELKITSEELQDTLEELATTNEELTSSNEELMSMNEELQSSNEELETSKEELQALNEELTTVNSELNGKLDELGEANSLIENLMASSNVATVFVDKDLIIRTFTPQAEDIFHLIPSDVGRPLRHVVSKLRYDVLVDDCSNVLETLSQHEAEVDNDDGRTFLMRLFPYRTVKNLVDGVVLTFVDVTESRKHKEQLEGKVAQRTRELAEREALLRATGKMAKVGGWKYYPKDKQVVWSEEVYHIHELDRNVEPSVEEAINFYHPADRLRLTKALESAVERGAPYDLELRLVTAKGRNLWVRAKCEPEVVDGDAVCLHGIIQDITDLRQAEESLRQSESKLNALFETMSEMVVLHELIVDQDGEAVDYRIVDCNQAFTRITGIEKHEAVGKLATEVYQVASPPYLKEYATVAVGDDSMTFTSYYEPLKKHFMISVISPKPNHFATITSDITSLKEAERDLLEAKERAEAANEAKSTFLANMSHELRTPMNGVLGMAQLLWDTGLTEEQKEYIETLTNCGESLMGILGDILTLASIEAGKMTLEEKPFDCRTVVEEIARLFKHEAAVKGLSLEMDIVGDVPCQHLGDPLRLKQILCNLVGNAIKFTERGSVTIKASSECSPDRCDLEIAVIDTGKGISQEKLDLIFKAFEQGDLDAGEGYGGTGLGLSITRNLLKLMGGRIEVESEVGKGTTFTVRLSLKRADALEPRSEETKGDGDVPKLDISILTVDDAQVNLMVAHKFASKFTNRVDVAKNGSQAVEMAKTKTYDLILMDVKMPGVDGLEATRRIRANEKDLDAEPCVIVAMTAHALREDRQNCLDAGMDDYLSKPVRFKSLKALIHRYFGRKSAIRS